MSTPCTLSIAPQFRALLPVRSFRAALAGTEASLNCQVHPDHHPPSGQAARYPTCYGADMCMVPSCGLAAACVPCPL